MADQLTQLVETVVDHVAQARPLCIQGGTSKSFLGEPMDGELAVLETAGHSGIISYEPAELVLRARCGTRIAELVEALAGEGQVLGFEPPAFDGAATLGGTIASGISGPKRPWYGAARDFVLGVGLITGQGEHLEFGGQVMKNVAGFDVSRLMCGAMGTLGVITDISLKVLPAPQQELTLVQELSRERAHKAMLAIANQSIPVSGCCHFEGRFYVRLSGTEAGVSAAADAIGGDVISTTPWRSLANASLPVLAGASRLWRISVPATSPELLGEAGVIDWAGAQRWLVDPPFDPRQRISSGHASLYRAPADETRARFQPLSPVARRLHTELKRRLDPGGIFNPGRLYREL